MGRLEIASICNFYASALKKKMMHGFLYASKSDKTNDVKSNNDKDG